MPRQPSIPSRSRPTAPRPAVSRLTARPKLAVIAAIAAALLAAGTPAVPGRTLHAQPPPRSPAPA